MKKMIFGCGLAICAMAPAAAFAEDGVRLEARGGVAWDGATEERIGVGVGYDYSFGGGFVGITQAIDTNAKFDFSEISTALRLGANVGEKDKAFAIGGFVMHNWENAEFLAGAGYEHSLGERTYVGIQYNRLMKSDVNRVLLSVGTHF